MGHTNYDTIKTDHGAMVLSDSLINQTMRTVHLRSTGKRWFVKKVADPKVWRFSQPRLALAKAVDLARPDAYRVVVHDKNWKADKVITPDAFGDLAKLAMNFRGVQAPPLADRAAPRSRRRIRLSTAVTVH